MILPLPMFTAPSYMDRTLNEVQRCVNLYPEKTPDGYRLISSPGVQLLHTVSGGGSAFCALAYFSSNGRLFSSQSALVYEIRTSASPVSRGTLNGLRVVDFADDGETLFVVDDDGDCYTLAMSTNTFAQVTDADLPVASSGTYQDGYFIVSKAGTAEFYISARGDATSWDALDFATAEAKGDVLTAVFSNGTTLFLIGTRTVELWYNTQNPDFPFEKISGASYQFGCEAKRSINSIDGNVYFLGTSDGGKGAVWAFEGNTPRRISTDYLETIFQSFLPEYVRSSCYTIDGHSFYQIMDIELDRCFIYDIGEGVWHERESYDSSGTPGYRPLFSIIINAFSAVGYTNPIAFRLDGGEVYLLGGSSGSPANSENSVAMRRMRIFGPIEAGASRVFHHRIRFVLEIKHDSEASYSLAPTLDWSDDGGLTWSTARTLTKAITSGTTGQRVMLEALRLGSSRQRYYRLTFTGPAARIVLQSAELDMDVGRN